MYLIDMADYGVLNEVYSAFFDVPGTSPPVRLCLSVDALPVQGLVEVQCTGHWDGPWAAHHGLKNATAGGTATTAAPSSAAVRSWLEGIGLAEYAPSLIAAGYDDMDVFAAGVSGEELRAAGVRKPGHVRKLLLRAAALGLA